MKIAIWKTGHEIADTVAAAIYAGMCKSEYNVFSAFNTNLHDVKDLVSKFDVHIGYGILRGMDKVFRECDRQGKPWIHIDRGYFNPGHYDGYYRVSLCGTQQTIGLADTANITSIKKYKKSKKIKGHVLLCPPTSAAADFFDQHEWLEYWLRGWREMNNFECIVRYKGDPTPLENHLKDCGLVMTFNSLVAVKALEMGVEVCSDPTHSIIGAYQKLIDNPLHLDIESRRKLFQIMGDLQMTLEEIRNGHLCTLIPKLLSLYMSDGTPANPSQVKWPRTV